MRIGAYSSALPAPMTQPIAFATKSTTLLIAIAGNAAGDSRTRSRRRTPNPPGSQALRRGRAAVAAGRGAGPGAR